ncbi:hypothetical protein BWQ96_06729 [Gracilariopsis chorda]|uniref:Uncharacterized protein n=1 Tax=Gracilariopsis chorda TaxID=448386 RepID=A0A2V3IN75_9FLOR|nr:hypothetical protein BWQ96_06729 [Gracilariopsis chorda]|eukprot:PXF43528.1 hypothetical protein BWQ96_06729 [Gracilariopsis chorda]
MMTKELIATALMLVGAITSACAMTHPKSFYLSLSPEALFAYGVKGAVGACYISLNTGSSSYCDLYVNTATIGNNGHRGWPRKLNDMGTGCVKAPEFPRKRTYCWYSRSEYINHPQAIRDTFCTHPSVTNAANQLRDAVEKDQCAL